MSDFMQRQVTGLENWLQVETSQGSEFIRIADTSLFVRNSQTLTHPATESDKFSAKTKIGQYTTGEPQEWENVKGYGARQNCWCGKIGEAHHPDYSKPLDVIWLCSEHHAQVHKSY